MIPTIVPTIPMSSRALVRPNVKTRVGTVVTPLLVPESLDRA